MREGPEGAPFAATKSRAQTMAPSVGAVHRFTVAGMRASVAPRMWHAYWLALELSSRTPRQHSVAAGSTALAQLKAVWAVRAARVGAQSGRSTHPCKILHPQVHTRYLACGPGLSGASGSVHATVCWCHAGGVFSLALRRGATGMPKPASLAVRRGPCDGGADASSSSASPRPAADGADDAIRGARPGGTSDDVDLTWL